MSLREKAVPPEIVDSVDVLRGFTRRLMEREDLDRREASDFLTSMLSPSVTDAQIAAALVALASKGETADELAGMAEVMRSLSRSVRSSHERFIDTAGTGSSSARTFNVSTAAAFVVAGAGLPVAKHGGRAATGRCGSADVLNALGVNVNASGETSEHCLNEIGICFMFAPLYHSATARVAGIRRELAVPTTFNLLGPLTNPAKAPFQIVGVWRQSVVKPMAEALRLLGTQRAWVVHGRDSLDEITIATSTVVAEANAGEVKEFELQPEDFGLRRSSPPPLQCADAMSSARLLRDIVAGNRHDVVRDLVVINSAAALFVGGVAKSLLEAGEMARASIDNGSALTKLNDLIRLTTG
jgi:anthranilate phosphoribosyltransferase